MAVINLTKGLSTQVDDEDFEELSIYSWHASGLDGRPARRLRAGPRKMIFIYHQILCLLPWVISLHGYNVDHIDGNPLNNRRANLRLVTRKENMRNTLRHSARVGVGYDGTHNRWKAYIDEPDMPRINIGTFITYEEAETAMLSKRKELGLEIN